jgi:hypothetical protein
MTSYVEGEATILVFRERNGGVVFGSWLIAASDRVPWRGNGGGGCLAGEYARFAGVALQSLPQWVSQEGLGAWIERFDMVL